MNKSLNALVIPVIVLILVVGVLLPIFSTIKEERCSLAFSKVIESDLLLSKSPEQIIAEQSDTIAYLMKYPKQTLKNCIAYEDENLNSSKDDLIWNLAKIAYGQITNENLPEEPEKLNEFIKAKNPELYAELVEK